VYFTESQTAIKQTLYPALEEALGVIQESITESNTRGISSGKNALRILSGCG
jgi:hypothetical protein